MSTDWPRVRLHVVTGKGGTGKTTVAASLALALASQGKNVLLCEVEGRQGIARMFDVDPLPYAERRIATGLRTNACVLNQTCLRAGGGPYDRGIWLILSGRKADHPDGNLLQLIRR